MSVNFSACASVTNRSQRGSRRLEGWLRGRDLNPRPLGYEPNELPDCSTPRQSPLQTQIPIMQRPEITIPNPQSEINNPKSLVGLGRVELPTSRLSGVRSNQLSYRPQVSSAPILTQKRATLLSECGP